LNIFLSREKTSNISSNKTSSTFRFHARFAHKTKRHFARRVPTEFAHLDPRGVVKHSTKIKIASDRAGMRASRVADKFNKALERYWRDLADGKSREQINGYNEARRRARQLGFDYVENAQLVSAPAPERLERLETLVSKDLVNDGGARAAVLGLEKRPVFKVSKLFEEYQAETTDQVLDLSPDQLRIWRNGRTRAVKTFVEVVGEKLITEITVDHAIDYRQHWRDRVVNEGVAAKTANREIGQLSGMIKEMNILRRLGMPDLFKGLRLKGEVDKEPTPFETEFIQDSLLADGALDRLNEEARLVIYVIADAGLRPCEIVNLNSKTIHLDAKIPYVNVLPDGRRPKTEHSIRQVPVVGSALAALKKRPEGFPRYHDNSLGFSATANKFLLENKLRPTLEHTVYSLRHSFKDRLIGIEAQDSMIDALMGHDNKKPRYGKGPSLELKLKYLQQIAFVPSPSLA
jgi:integrase